ncbi:DUF1441 family protein, partial [Escherichia coli]|uniref:DUF1441 family protein n=1 Tax=Escherichia coli TaxID=562 RepID=UPI00201A51C4
MSNVSGIGDAYYWSVFKIAEAFGLHRDTVKKRLLAANTPVAATVRGNPVYALQHVGPALFSVKHEAADSVHDPSRMGKRLTRTVLIFTESSDQLSRATDRVP